MGKEIETRQCFILGAGDVLDYGAVASRLEPDAYIICADGGYDHCRELGITPHLLMGDFDSVRTALPADIQRITLPVGKDYTDTAFAIEEALGQGFFRLYLSGMLGGRLDHTFANIQSLGYCASRGADTLMTDGVTDIYAMAAGEEPSVLVLEPRKDHYFSLFALTSGCRAVTINGAAYPLDRYPLGSLDPRAISNEFQGGPVRITLEEGVLAVIITPRR